MASNNDMASVTHWPEDDPPTEESIRGILRNEELDPFGWQNQPGDTYAVHSHEYNKVIYVVRGEIEFTLPDRGSQVPLVTGDRLYLPRYTRHGATVGSTGVYCLEAHC